MNPIVQIAGNVTYPIVLDPSSWIFDNRKIEWNDYVSQTVTIDDVLDNKKDERAGAAMPRLVETKVKYQKDRWLTDSFVIPTAPFLENAQVNPDAKSIRFERANDADIVLPIEVVQAGVFGFSKKGKIIQEDGPLHFYNLEDYKDQPITKISKIIVE